MQTKIDPLFAKRKTTTAGRTDHCLRGAVAFAFIFLCIFDITQSSYAQDSALRKSKTSTETVITDSSSDIVIAVFDAPDSHPHAKSVQQVITDNIASCKRCRLMSFPIYNKNGDLIEKGFLYALDQAVSAKAQIFHFSWNMLASAKTEKLKTRLKELAEKNKLLVLIAAAGVSRTPGRINRPLSDSVMGQVANALIIGEKNSKGTLDLQSFYGPEMFTALTPVSGHPGSSFTAAVFSARVATALEHEDLVSLLKRLRMRKQQSTDVYPELDFLFARP